LQPGRSLAELERWRADPRFVGAKTIQDFFRMRLDDARYTPLIERLSTMPGWPLMAHLPGMKEAASRHRDVVFVAAHSTWRHRELAALPNVWFDIATSTPLIAETDIRDLIDAVGPDRVLFSSDAPLMDPGWTLGKLAGLDLAEADAERIFTHNALEAFPRLRLET
jgi:predicted TIM-barrel fold metal-dependent hydrolase